MMCVNNATWIWCNIDKSSDEEKKRKMWRKRTRTMNNNKTNKLLDMCGFHYFTSFVLTKFTYKLIQQLNKIRFKTASHQSCVNIAREAIIYLTNCLLDLLTHAFEVQTKFRLPVHVKYVHFACATVQQCNSATVWPCSSPTLQLSTFVSGLALYQVVDQMLLWCSQPRNAVNFSSHELSGSCARLVVLFFHRSGW